MKHGSSIWAYMKKAIEKLWPYSLAAAIAIGVVFPFPAFSKVILEYEAMAELSMWELYAKIFNLSFGKIVCGILGIIIAAMAFSVMSSMIERDMHIGVFVAGNFFKHVSNDFYAFFVFLFYFVLLMFVLFVLDVAIIYLWMLFLPKGIGIALTALTAGAMGFLAIVGISFTMLWPHIMLYIGLKPLNALKRSLSLMKSNIAGVFWHITLMVTVYAAFMFLMSFIWPPLMRAGNVVTLFVGMIYFSILINTVYYDVMGLDREDLIKASIWTKKY